MNRSRILISSQPAVGGCVCAFCAQMKTPVFSLITRKTGRPMNLRKRSKWEFHPLSLKLWRTRCSEEFFPVFGKTVRKSSNPWKSRHPGYDAREGLRYVFPMLGRIRVCWRLFAVQSFQGLEGFVLNLLNLRNRA